MFYRTCYNLTLNEKVLIFKNDADVAEWEDAMDLKSIGSEKPRAGSSPAIGTARFTV